MISDTPTGVFVQSNQVLDFSVRLKLKFNPKSDLKPMQRLTLV